MNFKQIPSWLYSLLLSILIVGIYKITNRNNEEDNNIKYFVIFILLFVISFIGFSYVIDKKNYLKLPQKLQKGGSKTPSVNQSQNIEIDPELPNF